MWLGDHANGDLVELRWDHCIDVINVDTLFGLLTEKPVIYIRKFQNEIRTQ